MPDSALPHAAMFFALMAASGVGTRFVLAHARRVSLFDVPDHRSSHTSPKPRGGGLSIAALWVLGLPLAAGIGVLPWRIGLALTGGGALVAAVGWIDDHGHVAPRIRFAAHLAAAVWTVALLGGLSAPVIGPYTLELGILGSAVAVLGLVWMINLYNFMDGIDGIAGVEALTGGLAVAVLLGARGDGSLAFLPVGLAGAAAGFLLWNWAPARIFMGDVGSGLLGYAFGALALAGETAAGVPAAILLVPLGVFILDATVTLGRRLGRGERVYEAHRSHVYQRLLQEGWDPRRICAAVGFLNATLLCAAVLALRRPELYFLIVLTAAALITTVAVGMLRWGSGRP